MPRTRIHRSNAEKQIAYRKRKRLLTGHAILSAKLGRNADIFPDILKVYAPQGSRILDATFGKGNFWKKINTAKYDLVTNDLIEAADFHFDLRSIPLPDSSFDTIVLDPPYMNREEPFHHAGYGVGLDGVQTQKQIRALYVAGCAEALRLLKSSGILILKCQNCGQHWNHLFLSEVAGFDLVDEFVLVQSDRTVWDRKWKHQHRARKNHSYFLVHRKR